MSQAQQIKPISVTPTEMVFSINWSLGNRCNYDCMYCPSYWHDDYSRHRSLADLQMYWQDILKKTQSKNLKYKISFTGGEVTNNRNFKPFVTWLRQNYGEHINKILVTTNGSANYSYYHRLFELVDNISFSVHSEHIHESKFFEMIFKLKSSIDSSKFIHVNIMNEFWNQDRIQRYKQILEEHQISYGINEIDYSRQTRQQPVFKGKLDLELQESDIL